MMRYEEQKNRNKGMISYGKIHAEYPGAQGDKDESKFLEPGFESESVDLDEEENTEDELDDGRVEKNIYHRVQNSENCTVIGTNSFGKKISILVFSVDSVLHRNGPVKTIAEKYNISFKIQKTECKLVRTILSSHGLQECSSSNNDCNILWTGCHVRPFTLRTMSEFQKINHFPRSYEVTRKDRLFKNVQRMQQIKGLKNFDFLPPSYLIPSEFQELCHNFSKDKGPYIVKPVALSRGRGIFLCNHPNQIPLDEQLIVSKYISNPYLIDGLKFDMRMYVLVTSYDPLVIYLYEEGLTRFATVKYHNAPKNLRTQCMHLTNYSVNKKNNSFVQNDNADVEDFGNKWSLGALLRHLKSKDIDTNCLMMKIEDIIIKSLISVESQISSSCRMFQPYHGNCFELYGYDIIIDENLRPWLLEVNLSPSLSCDSPLDFKIKSHMLSDMFNVIGVACQDPVLKNNPPSYNNTRMTKSAVSRTSQSPNPRGPCNPNVQIRRPTAGLRRKEVHPSVTSYKNDDLRLVRRIKEENKRCGGWIRIFPTPESINTYMPFFHNGPADQTNMNAYTGSQTNLNMYLHSKLYPDRHNDQTSSNPRLSAQNTSIRSRLALHSVNYSAALHKLNLSQILPSGQSFFDKISNNYIDTQSRLPYYERRLGEEVTTKDNLPRENILRQSTKNRPFHVDSKAFVDDSDNLTSSNSSTSASDKEDCSNDSDVDADEEEYTNTNLHSSGSHSSKESVSVMKIVDSGGKLTKIQARLAFSSYLARVQYRLLTESRSDIAGLSAEEENSRHEQLELVLRFLKRAASNMSPEEFTIPSIPERSLTLRFRQEWLAKLLGEFIRIYTRETKLAEAKPNNNECFTDIDNKSFLQFLRIASENDLEQTLSNYTKVNKSAGIFLNSSLSLKTSTHQPEVPTPYPPLGFHKSASMSNLASREKESSDTMAKSLKSYKSTSSSKNQGSVMSSSNKESSSSSQPISDNQSYNRPTSANHSSMRPGSTKLGSGNVRPCTSNIISRSKDSSKNDRSYDPEAISKALQRLAAEHRSRQLTASASNLCDSDCDESQKRSTGAADTLTRALLKQYEQSKKLLQESRAKHDAILSQSSADVTYQHPKSVLVQKPPSGVFRSSQQSRLSCTMKK